MMGVGLRRRLRAVRRPPTVEYLGTSVTSSFGSTHDVSVGFGTGAPNDLYVVFVAHSTEGGNTTVSSVVLGQGVDNLSGSKIVSAGDGTQHAVGLWQRVGNLSGTKTIRVSVTSNRVRVWVFRIRGYRSSTPVDADQFTTTGTSVSISATAAKGGVAVGGVMKSGTSGITMTGLSKQSEQVVWTDNATRGAVGMLAGATAGTLTMGASWTSSSSIVKSAIATYR